LWENAGRTKNCLGEDQSRVILPSGTNLPTAQIEPCFISIDLKHNGSWRKKENFEINSLDKAEKNFNDLWNEQNFFDITVQKRLKMIKGHWKNLIMFHFVEGAPAANNSIENYYSTSLKTHRKKQFRTDMGIINQLQLSSMKRAGMFNELKPRLFELFMAFIPFINY